MPAMTCTNRLTLRADGEGGEDLPAELAVARVAVLLVRQGEKVCAHRISHETGAANSQTRVREILAHTIPERYIAVGERLGADGEQVLAVTVARREGVRPSRRRERLRIADLKPPAMGMLFRLTTRRAR